MKISWESTGTGAPLLLIQGLGYARWGWDPVVPALAEHFRVVTFDNRGIGESDKPSGPYSARDMAADAAQVLDEAGVEHAHLLGASLGGMIAQELAVAAPDRVERLVLCCTTPGGADAVAMPEVTVRLLQEAATLAPEVALRRFVANALGDEPRAGLVDELYRRRLASPPDPAGWQAQGGAGPTFPGGGGPIALGRDSRLRHPPTRVPGSRRWRFGTACRTTGSAQMDRPLRSTLAPSLRVVGSRRGARR